VLAYKKVTKQEVKRMNIVIKIMEGDKIIEHKSLSTEQKKEYGQKLNEQALAAAGYVRKE
jgi:hypothetical protein